MISYYQNFSKLLAAFALVFLVFFVIALRATGVAPVLSTAMRDCPDCPEIIVIPTGEFIMGSDIEEPHRYKLPEYWAIREQPKHKVSVSRQFALGEYEITRAQFKIFAKESGYSPTLGCWHFVGTEWLFDETRSWKDAKIGETDEYPVTCVNWHDANAYLAWLSYKTTKSYRLASEAEWEYVARAGTQTAFWFGDDPKNICHYVNLGDLDTQDSFGWDKTKIKYDAMTDWKGQPCRDGYSTLAPVRSTSANPWGVYGLLGNANEWVADCWNDDYQNAPATQEARLTAGDCGIRAMRGQGWTAIAAGTRSAFRLKMNATDRRFTFGFRVARDYP